MKLGGMLRRAAKWAGTAPKVLKWIVLNPPMEFEEDWAGKRIAAARAAGLLQVLLLAASCSAVVQFMVSAADVDRAMAHYLAYAPPSLPITRREGSTAWRMDVAEMRDAFGVGARYGERADLWS